MVRYTLTLAVVLLAALGVEARMQKRGSARKHAGYSNMTLPFDDPKELERRDGTKYVFMHHVRLIVCHSFGICLVEPSADCWQ